MRNLAIVSVVAAALLWIPGSAAQVNEQFYPDDGTLGPGTIVHAARNLDSAGPNLPPPPMPQLPVKPLDASTQDGAPGTVGGQAGAYLGLGTIPTAGAEPAGISDGGGSATAATRRSLRKLIRQLG